jgi:hypothetical protein
MNQMTVRMPDELANAILKENPYQEQHNGRNKFLNELLAIGLATHLEDRFAELTPEERAEQLNARA